MIEKATFRLDKYSFNKVTIDFDATEAREVVLGFDPSGIFKRNENGSIFELKLLFAAKDEETDIQFINIECNAVFRFAGNITLEDVPSFFYANSIAIVFPYIRAFVSTITLQSNFPALVLPTMNLSALESILKEQTQEM